MRTRIYQESTMDEPESDGHDAPALEDEAIRGHAERLGQQLAELYNENTLLRERVRVLEQQVRSGVKPA
jgi:hypothetical protein